MLLVHGLGRTRFSLAMLALRLSRSGHRPEFFSYSPFTEAGPRIVLRLVVRLRQWGAQAEEVGLVGHSFGGLLLREALAQVPELSVRQLVMLGTPNRQPRLAPLVLGRWPFRLFRGDCGRYLADPAWFGRLPRIACPYTLVAGTAGWRGRLSPFKGEANDGIVAVSETKVEESDQPVLLPVLHTFMMNSRAVHRLIVERL